MSGPSEPTQLPPTIGRYQLIRQLGEGGMGTVFEAWHTRLHTRVALKILPPKFASNPRAVARFEREMRAIGHLSHPGLVAARDADEADGFRYLAMELVDGLDLSRLARLVAFSTPIAASETQSSGADSQLAASDTIRETTPESAAATTSQPRLLGDEGDDAAQPGYTSGDGPPQRPFPIGAACELVRQAADTMHAVHEQRLVHRDLKPSNLMLARSGVVKVLDLGLARFEEPALASEASMTSSGEVIGTIDYMSPEQAAETYRSDRRTDVYALGATLYRRLTGQKPFASARFSTIIQKLIALANLEPRPIQELRADCHPALAAVIAGAMAKEPGDRTATAGMLAEQLAPFADAAAIPELVALLPAGRDLSSPPNAGDDESAKPLVLGFGTDESQAGPGADEATFIPGATVDTNIQSVRDSEVAPATSPVEAPGGESSDESSVRRATQWVWGSVAAAALFVVTAFLAVRGDRDTPIEADAVATREATSSDLRAGESDSTAGREAAGAGQTAEPQQSEGGAAAVSVADGGAFPTAIRLNASARVSLPITVARDEPLTLEATVVADQPLEEGRTGVIVSVGRPDTLLLLGRYGNRWSAWGQQEGKPTWRVDAERTVVLGERTRLAATFGEGHIRLFVDGVNVVDSTFVAKPSLPHDSLYRSGWGRRLGPGSSRPSTG